MTATSHWPAFRILGLRLLGYRKNYTIDFTDEAGHARALSIIAGEISTGKTTILEFIDFCLGSSSHPQHPEIVDSVKAAQLSIEVDIPVQNLDSSGTGLSDLVAPDAVRLGYSRQRYVFQRGVEGSTRDVLIFSGDLTSFDSVAPRLLSTDSSAEDSLSKFLLQLCGLDGIRLKVAPTKPDSATHALSFRDIAPLWFLSNTRLDNKNIAFEHQPPKALKLKQVVDLLFDVFDESGAILSGQIAELQSELSAERNGLKAVWRFIREQGVPDNPVELEALQVDAEGVFRQALLALEHIDDVARERTAFAEEARSEYLNKVQEARESENRARERETLLRRLAPLRAQYSDDLKKLTMLKEAKRLFDPLSVIVCPACASDIPSAEVVNGHCSLCRSEIRHLEHSALQDGLHPGADAAASVAIDDVDVTKELNSTRRRLKELNGYIAAVEVEAIEARKSVAQFDAESAELQRRLDLLTRDAITPLLSERDAVTAAVSDAVTVRSQLLQHQRMLESTSEKDRSVQDLAVRLSDLRRRLAESEANRRGRTALLDSLSARFSEILESFGYPKLSEAFIDKNLLPHVRGIRYDQVGSSGATTLISLAWELAIFELAYEEGRRHPGFLMVDSPQKNLAPETQPGQAAVSGEDEGFAGEAIVRRIYRHLDLWLRGAGAGAQIILVDNVPPPSVEGAVVARYGGAGGPAPYGLIDDAPGQ
ncbi:hypothetical protein [Streptomyces sp. XY431]|uniref:hypothetical protein n=1 Tax=Streptomyces sp. XY431 TaxID=1415562 RepID=UPI000A8D108D|nr:hypothetical protein [Streptomyces sp. XY431]